MQGNTLNQASHNTDQELINNMQQSSTWEADSHSASQEIACLLWNMKAHYLVHKSLPLVSILSQAHN
jgi:hypothetical protein